MEAQDGMPVGKEEKERGLGASCGLTHLLMGSGHSEKDRGGVRRFPHSRLPNGEYTLYLQETKIQVMSTSLVCSLGIGRFLE